MRDIRVIVFQDFPMMAMMRLPMQQGAVGVGINIVNGVTLAGVWHSWRIDEHPDSGAQISGCEIPHWDTILDIAARCHEAVGLGCLEGDIVLDEHRGPLVLELNARPGLNIQTANLDGLQRRFAIIDRLPGEQLRVSPAERIAFAKEGFQPLTS